MNYRCTRCGKVLDEFMIDIKSDISIYKKTSMGNFENYGSKLNPTHEYVCPECFDKYVDCLKQLNEEYNGKYLIDMVEVIDEVQYDC